MYRISRDPITDIEMVIDGNYFGTINSELGLDSTLSPIDRILDISGSCSCRLLDILGVAYYFAF